MSTRGMPGIGLILFFVLALGLVGAGMYGLLAFKPVPARVPAAPGTQTLAPAQGLLEAGESSAAPAAPEQAGAYSFDPAAELPTRLGRFRLLNTAALYLVVGAEPVRVRVRATGKPGDSNARVLLRALNPDETLTHWSYAEPEFKRAEEGLGIRVEAPAPLPILAEAEGRTVLLDVELALLEPGVHQLRLGGEREPWVEVAVSRPLDHGVSFQNGNYTSWDSPVGEVEPAWVYVPPRAESVQLLVSGNRRLQIEDAAGAVLLPFSHEGSKTLRITETGVLWRVRFAPVTETLNCYFRAAHMPFILCNSAAAAKSIRASVEVLPDGTVVSHKFQRRIVELLPSLLAPEKVGHANELIEPLNKRLDAWLSKPLENRELLNVMKEAEKALRSQNVDPSSPWCGSLDGWEKKIKLPEPECRWDRFGPIPGMDAGLSEYWSNPCALAWAYVREHPVNPYYKKSELMYRALAAGLKDLLRLQESEVWPGAAGDPYPTGMSFANEQRIFPAYLLLAPELPAELRALWTDALRRIVDRTYTDYLVSCRNQSSHNLTAYEEFAQGSGLPLYRDLSRRFAKRFVDGASPAGYQMEACGPCASYMGMTHWHMGLYWRMSKDPVMREALARSYGLYNHSVAPEPGGEILGGFNFNHRVGMGFFYEQYSGARRFAHADVPEVGLWMRGEDLEKRERESREALRKILTGDYLQSKTWDRWQHHDYGRDTPDASGTWPAQEPQDFIRNFGSEFIAVKRPAYYTLIYVGKPAGDFYIRDRKLFRQPMPGDAENQGGVAPAKPATPFAGGGLTLFWTSQYGSALTAANWSPLAHHGLVGVTREGERYWEDYAKTTFELDKAAGRLEMRGELEGQGLAYTRTYRFGPDALEVELVLKALKDVQLARLFENLPIAAGSRKKRGVEIEIQGEAEGKGRAKAFRILDLQGAGVAVEFQEARDLSAFRNGLRDHYNMLKVNRVEVECPAALKAGETATLRYTLRPFH
ncbi:MAG: hypothetical protein M5U26_25630 [Planctomycetota bacterium]|nr:hypothetical protein [Planctomycetota bacterium]